MKKKRAYKDPLNPFTQTRKKQSYFPINSYICPT